MSRARKPDGNLPDLKAKGKNASSGFIAHLRAVGSKKILKLFKDSYLNIFSLFFKETKFRACLMLSGASVSATTCFGEKTRLEYKL